MLSATKRRRALVSSTVQDLPEHRQAAIDACLRVGVEPLVLVPFSTVGFEVLAQLTKLFDQADIYIGILGFRYGFIPRGQNKALTEIEYELAFVRGIPRLLFVMSDNHPVRPTDVETGPGAEKLRQFKALVRREAIVTEFRSPEELKAAVVTGLVQGGISLHPYLASQGPARIGPSKGLGHGLVEVVNELQNALAKFLF